MVLLGRVAAGVLLAHAAYAPLAGFQAETGLPSVQYLFGARTDTHVSGYLSSLLLGLRSRGLIGK